MRQSMLNIFTYLPGPTSSGAQHMLHVLVAHSAVCSILEVIILSQSVSWVTSSFENSEDSLFYSNFPDKENFNYAHVGTNCSRSFHLIGKKEQKAINPGMSVMDWYVSTAMANSSLNHDYSIRYLDLMCLETCSLCGFSTSSR